MPRIIAALFLLASVASAAPYLGQPTPGSEPELFDSPILAIGARTRDFTFSPDGREFTFCVMVGGFRYVTMLTSKLEDGQWTEPVALPFATDPNWKFFEPHVTPDGQRLFFVSDRPAVEGQEGSEDIWVAERQGDGWAEPRCLDAPINTPTSEFYPSVTRSGTLYFTRRDAETRVESIMRAEPDGKGGWLEPVKLPEQVNAAPSQFNAFIDPDDRYLIVSFASHPENLGQVDYWVAFREPDGTWLGPVNLGDKINGPAREGWSCTVSPDGKYLFFLSSRDRLDGRDEPLSWDRLRQLHAEPGNGLGHMWWVEAEFIEDLRVQAGKTGDQ